jgi:ABC-type metal ion transport system substrate-binding protein
LPGPQFDINVFQGQRFLQDGIEAGKIKILEMLLEVLFVVFQVLLCLFFL